MLRAVLITKERDQHSGAETEQFRTVDFESPEIESAMKYGGFAENGYSVTQLVGVEILPNE